MKSFEYVIADELGIHSRPAGMIVKKAKEYESGVTIRAGDRQADATRLFQVMGLAAKQGQSLTFEVSGPDEEKAAAELLAFLESHV
ncbi:HPr family phosphocarrier protein [Allofournierella sp.]|uniref:HPr family phosphocarrier protein n=1 Tax=Allofournierella sp. TaxID=1940256 RepID=UPI003AF0D9FE